MKLILKICAVVFVPLLLALIVYIGFINYYKARIYSSAKDIPEAYAAFVLGAQIRGNEPSYYLYERISAAAKLSDANKVKKIIMSGDNTQPDYNEPAVMVEAARQIGIPASMLVTDPAGRSTYESCYRARYIFGQDKIIIVTQRYHLYRAIYLCEKVGLKVAGYEAQSKVGIDLPNMIREILATLLAVYEVNFKPREVIMGDPIVI